MKILLVTNDFPPRVGGIQNYLLNIYTRLAPHEVSVLAPAYPGDAAFDAALPFEVVRHPTRIYWPSPELRHKVRDIATSHGSDVLSFGAVVPANLIAKGVDLPVVVHTHGFEVAWARTPALMQLLRRMGERSSLMTVVSAFTERFIHRALGDRARIEMLRTGVDLERFHPLVDGAAVRKRYGLAARPVIACVSRLVSRKGQDQLIRALPLVQREIPDAALLIAGAGAARERLESMARPRGESVVFAGEVPESELAAHYSAGDVFAMPVRSRYAGLEVEGLGLVYLEAQACGRPAITGDSGGAPEAVIPNETGLVVGGRDRRGLAEAIVRILGDPIVRDRMGAAGRAFVEREHHWDAVAARYRGYLESIR